MTDPRHDPDMKAALDRFTAPPLPPGFADRVVAAAMAKEAAPSLPPPLPAARRGAIRRAWRRPTRIVAGALAMSLISAAAAATGYLGDRVQTITHDLPVVGPMIAQVVPAPKPKPRTVIKRPSAAPEQRQGLAEAPSPAEQAGLAGPALTETDGAIRREKIAERIVTGLERRAERRAALGLPKRPPRPRETMAVLRRIPPEDRRDVIRRVRALRQERAAAGLSPEPIRRPAMAEDSSLPVPDAQVVSSGTTGQPDQPATENADTDQPMNRAERLRRFRELRQRRLEQLREPSTEPVPNPE